ncbi:hypothetical protein D3C85_1934720 [compost metagenome]
MVSNVVTPDLTRFSSKAEILSRTRPFAHVRMVVGLKCLPGVTEIAKPSLGAS